MLFQQPPDKKYQSKLGDWYFLKLEGEINPNIDFESWLNSIDYKEYIEKFAMPGVDSVTESEVDDDLPL